MKETGPLAVPPPDIFSLELERIVLRLLPAPEPNLKSMASVLARSMMLDIESSTELMKHALHCGFASMPTLNQTGELNAIFWWTSRWVSSALKVARSSSRGEVALGLGPGRDRVDDPVDELADAGLALRGVEVAAEVLADHDVGGELRPERRDLDVLLLEDALAALGADAGGPVLPRDLVVGMDPGRRPAALERQALGRLAGRIGAVEAGPIRTGVAARCLRRLVGAVHDGRAVRSGHLLSPHLSPLIRGSYRCVSVVTFVGGSLGGSPRRWTGCGSVGSGVLRRCCDPLTIRS